MDTVFVISLLTIINGTLKCLSSLPILIQESFWWWQWHSLRYSSPNPTTHFPPPHAISPPPPPPQYLCGDKSAFNRFNNLQQQPAQTALPTYSYMWTTRQLCGHSKETTEIWMVIPSCSQISTTRFRLFHDMSWPQSFQYSSRTPPN